MTRADKAKGNLVEIRRLISLANNNTAKANDEIDDARNLVGDAENIAKSGSETSSKTNDVSADVGDHVCRKCKAHFL